MVSAEPLYHCAGLGLSSDILRCLVKDLGADVNGIEKDGATASYFAAQNAHLASVRCLVNELGANVHQMVHTNTALHIAAKQGHGAIVQCLVKEFGAEVNQANHVGATPLIAAAQTDQSAVMRLLVTDLGADVNQTRHDGVTALYFAAHEGRLGAVRWLIKELGADIEKTRHDGCTPLIAASANMHADVGKSLIKAGVDPQVTSRWGRAEDISNTSGASAEQMAYLQAKTQCLNSSCSGAGLLICTGCKQARYCGEPCQLAHWKSHKVDCKCWSAELNAPTEMNQT